MNYKLLLLGVVYIVVLFVLVDKLYCFRMLYKETLTTSFVVCCCLQIVIFVLTWYFTPVYQILFVWKRSYSHKHELQTFVVCCCIQTCIFELTK